MNPINEYIVLYCYGAALVAVCCFEFCAHHVSILYEQTYEKYNNIYKKLCQGHWHNIIYFSLILAIFNIIQIGKNQLGPSHLSVYRPLSSVYIASIKNSSVLLL